MKPAVLYFDDETSVLDVFQQMFAAEYDVRIATRLAEARRMLAEHPGRFELAET